MIERAYKNSICRVSRFYPKIKKLRNNEFIHSIHYIQLFKTKRFDIVCRTINNVKINLRRCTFEAHVKHGKKFQDIVRRVNTIINVLSTLETTLGTFKLILCNKTEQSILLFIGLNINIIQ